MHTAQQPSRILWFHGRVGDTSDMVLAMSRIMSSASLSTCLTNQSLLLDRYLMVDVPLYLAEPIYFPAQVWPDILGDPLTLVSPVLAPAAFAVSPNNSSHSQ